MDKKQTALLIKQIDSLYPGKMHLDATTVEIWHKTIGKQDYDKTIDALIRYSRENKFPPSIADLYQREMEAYNSNILDQIREWEASASRKQ